MIFRLINRPDRIGTNIMSILFQLYFCHKYKYFLSYNKNNICFDSIYIVLILKIIDDFNSSLPKVITDSIAHDTINISGPGVTDMCYGMGMIISEIKVDMLSYFKENFYNQSIKDLYIENTKKYNIPFDIDNSIIIHLRLDDQWWEDDYDGKICSDHYINLINKGEKCFFTNGPGNKYNKQNPLSSCKIQKQLEILKKKYPGSVVVVIASPLTQIPDLSFTYDMLIQSSDYNYDLFLMTKAKKIILSRSQFSLLSLFFGDQTDVHMPLWGHFACAGFGTNYDKNKITYFY